MDTTINFLDVEDLLGFPDDSLSRLFDNCNDFDVTSNFGLAEINKESSLGIDSNLMQNWTSTEKVHSEHDYASQPSQTHENVQVESYSQLSPTHLSDSGISSSSSRSPNSDYSRRSPIDFLNEANSPSTSSSDDGSDAKISLLDDLQFDFSDIDMENVAKSFPMSGDSILESCFNNVISDDVCIRLEDGLLSEKDKSHCPIPVKRSKIAKIDMKGISSPKNVTQQSMTISPQSLAIQDLLKNKTSGSTKFKCTLPNFKPLVLSEEERRLLEEENVTLPTDLPLTKSEERILKKVRRKIRNKKSAMESRKRRKEYLGGLEDRVTQCTEQNTELVKKVKELESQNATLISQLKRLQEIVKATSNKTTQATTCVMVLLLSFGLFLAPNYGPFSIKKSDDMQALEVSETHKSRRMLEITEPETKRPRIEQLEEVEVPVIDTFFKEEAREGEFLELSSAVKLNAGVKPYHETDTGLNKVQQAIKKENNSSNDVTKPPEPFPSNKQMNALVENETGIPGSIYYSEHPDTVVGDTPKIFQPHPPDHDYIGSSLSLQEPKVKIVHVSRMDEM